MKSSKEILIAAKELISDPKKWTQCEFARDAEGEACPVRRPCAVSFCSVGAILLVSSIHTAHAVPDAESILEKASKTFGFDSISKMNDQSEHEDVMRVFDLAISICD